MQASVEFDQFGPVLFSICPATLATTVAHTPLCHRYIPLLMCENGFANSESKSKKGSSQISLRSHVGA